MDPQEHALVFVRPSSPRPLSEWPIELTLAARAAGVALLGLSLRAQSRRRRATDRFAAPRKRQPEKREFPPLFALTFRASDAFWMPPGYESLSRTCRSSEILQREPSTRSALGIQLYPRFQEAASNRRFA